MTMLPIQIDKPLLFFDIESTGLHVIRDRIVQLGMIKYVPDSDVPIEREYLMNPGRPISREAQSVHGIFNEDVAHEKSFADLADELFDFIGDADLAGYNSNRFDVPMLMEEFARAGKDFTLENRKTIDVQTIFYKMEPRTLEAALEFYCDEKMEDAHDAISDVRATAKVLAGQISRYKDVRDENGKQVIVETADALADFTTNKSILDATQRLKYDREGTVVFNFGKYRGQPVGKVMTEDKNYLAWILNKEFSVQVKRLVQREADKYAGQEA